jgi:hypothetical protein
MERPLHPPTSLLHPHDAHTPSLLPFFFLFYFTSTITGEMRERERKKRGRTLRVGGSLYPGKLLCRAPVASPPARPADALDPGGRDGGGGSGVSPRVL